MCQVCGVDFTSKSNLVTLTILITITTKCFLLSHEETGIPTIMKWTCQEFLAIGLMYHLCIGRFLSAGIDVSMRDTSGFELIICTILLGVGMFSLILDRFVLPFPFLGEAKMLQYDDRECSKAKVKTEEPKEDSISVWEDFSPQILLRIFVLGLLLKWLHSRWTERGEQVVVEVNKGDANVEKKPKCKREAFHWVATRNINLAPLI